LTHCDIMGNSTCSCPGFKEKVISLDVPSYTNETSSPPDGGNYSVFPSGLGTATNQNLGQIILQAQAGQEPVVRTPFSAREREEEDYMVPIAEPYSDKFTAAGHYQIVDQESTEASREGAGQVEEDSRSADAWALDQTQFAHLPPLPSGWIRVKSKTSGIYFCFVETGETTFEHPTGKTSAQGAGLPPGWIEMVSRSSGQVYYWNEELQISQFEAPTASQGRDEEDGELPLGWVAMVSRSTGKTYYFHAESQESQFDRPY